MKKIARPFVLANRFWKAAISGLLLAAFATFLVACSSNSPTTHNASTTVSPPSSPTGGSGATVNIPSASQFCATLTAAEIGKVLGDTFPNPQPAQNGGAGQEIDCTTTGTTNNLALDYSYFYNLNCNNGQRPSSTCLSIQSGAFNAAKSGDSQSGETVQPVNGIGDEAFCAFKTIAGVQTATVDALKQWFMIQVSADTCAHDISLAQIIMSKL